MKNQTPQFRAQFHALGCRLNQAEMHGLESMLEGDVAIVNSCAVTNEAVRQTRQLIRRLKRQAPQRPVYVTGCAAQLAPETFAAMPEVSGVVANKDKLAPQAWGALEAVRLKKDFEDTPRPRPRAYIKVQNGCDHACTFCIIPQARGASSSVPAGQVVQAVQAALDAGSREIVLTGVDLTSWGGDLPGRPALSWLLGCLFRHITQDFRLRLTSLDGVELDEAFFDLFAGEPRFAPHLHLSFQSGNDLILKRMRRRHQREAALALCRRLRACRPETTLGADFIAGFPTETERMFEDTLHFIQEAGLVLFYTFFLMRPVRERRRRGCLSFRPPFGKLGPASSERRVNGTWRPICRAASGGSSPGSSSSRLRKAEQRPMPEFAWRKNPPPGEEPLWRLSLRNTSDGSGT